MIRDTSYKAQQFNLKGLKYQPGTEVTLTIIRKRQSRELRVALGELNTNGR